MKYWQPKWHPGRTPKEFFYSVIMYNERVNRCVNESLVLFCLFATPRKSRKGLINTGNTFIGGLKNETT